MLLDAIDIRKKIKMKSIKVYVPDNDCMGCDFLSHSCHEISYQCYQESYYCTIFKCNIERKQKCVACKMFAQPIEQLRKEDEGK